MVMQAERTILIIILVSDIFVQFFTIFFLKIKKKLTSLLEFFYIVWLNIIWFFLFIFEEDNSIIFIMLAYDFFLQLFLRFFFLQ